MSGTPRRVRVLVHGTGSIGMRHLRVLRALPGVQTFAMPVREERRSAPELAEHRVVASYAEARELGVTAAVVATDTGRHLGDAMAAIAAGCDVLVEKPVAARAAGVAELAEAAAAHGRAVYVAQNMRFLASLVAVRAMLPRLGGLRSVRIECQSYLPDWRPDRDYRASYSARAEDGGVLRDLVHELDYGAWLFGRPERVFATTRRGVLGIEAEEEADLLWTAGTATISMRLDYVTRVARRRLQADGEHGTLVWNGLTHVVTLCLAGAAEIVSPHPMERDAMMAAQARAFLATLGGGETGDLATLDDGAFAVALADAARRSAAAGEWAGVDDWRDGSG